MNRKHQLSACACRPTARLILNIALAALVALALGIPAACATPEADPKPETELVPDTEHEPGGPEQQEQEPAPDSAAEHNDEPRDRPDERAEAYNEKTAEAEEFEVSEELYEETFSEIEQVIADLNRVIAERDYEAWRELLTDRFVEVHSDADILERRSESPVLQRRGILLETLQDYFEYVVVPSRANARLDDLRFLDDNRVEALMEIRGQEILLYQLKRKNASWKIDHY